MQKMKVTFLFIIKVFIAVFTIQRVGLEKLGQ